MWLPANQAFSVSGSFSQVSANDGRFVLLTPKGSEQYTNSEVTQHNEVARKLLDDDLFCKTVIVDKNTKISEAWGKIYFCIWMIR